LIFYKYNSEHIFIYENRRYIVGFLYLKSIKILNGKSNTLLIQVKDFQKRISLKQKNKNAVAFNFFSLNK